jgi:hypothetical protein
LTLVDVESRRSAEVRLSAAQAEVVSRGFESWCATLSAQIRQSRFGFTRCDAGMDWQAALVAHLSAMRGIHA